MEIGNVHPKLNEFLNLSKAADIEIPPQILKYHKISYLINVIKFVLLYK